MFKKKPSYQLYFDHFARVSHEALLSNIHFLAHSSRTAFAFETAVGLLEKPVELHHILEHLGEKHRKFHLTADHFQVHKHRYWYYISILRILIYTGNIQVFFIIDITFIIFWHSLEYSQNFIEFKRFTKIQNLKVLASIMYISIIFVYFKRIKKGQ